MKIKIDNRERELIKHIQQLIEKSYPSLTISIETLPLGDIILTDNDDNEKIIMERKSILDLASSIRDGRYDEQSYRLDGIHFPNHNICYLVEGEMNSFTMNRFKTKVDKPTIFSAILSLNYYKGFSVIRTFSIEETAFFICNSAYKLEKEKDKKGYYETNLGKERNAKDSEDAKDVENAEKGGDAKDVENAEKEDNTKNYVNVVKRVKKDNITPENIGSIMICQIPGISPNIANVIMEKYKSLPELIEQIKSDSFTSEDIFYTTKTGIKKKINKNILSNIKKFLKL